MKILKEAELAYLALITAAAWVAFAEHPTAHRLRTAIVDTLDLS